MGTSANPSARALRRRMSEEEKKQAYEDRDAKFRIRQQIYDRFREATELMAGLPRAGDAADIVRTRDRQGIVTKRIPVIAQWLKDYQEAWDANEKK